MKVAIIGLGVIGNVHKSIIEDLDVDLVAACDVDANKSDGTINIPFYSNYIEMLEKEKPDVVHICTPHHLHADMVIECLSRNVNVLCEKPLCIKKEDIPRILKAEKDSKAILGVCHQNRYNKEYLFIKDYIKDKKVLGGTASVVWNRDKDYYAQAEWRGKWATEGGGVLINQSLHTLDIMQWLIGMPKTVSASISNLTLKDYIEVEDTASLVCSGDKSFTFFATNASTQSLPVSVTVVTEDELIYASKNKVVCGAKVHDFSGEVKVFGKECYGMGHLPLIEDFYDCVTNGKKFQIDGEEGTKVVKIVLSAYESNGNKISI